MTVEQNQILDYIQKCNKIISEINRLQFIKAKNTKLAEFVEKYHVDGGSIKIAYLSDEEKRHLNPDSIDFYNNENWEGFFEYFDELVDSMNQKIDSEILKKLKNLSETSYEIFQ